MLSHTALDPNPVVVAERRHFYLGSVRGRKVIVAMTGIGMVNATELTETALARFPSTVDAVVFSGVAGGAGRTGIADVAVPARWTQDNGTTFHPVDAGMLAAAENLSVTLKTVRRMRTGRYWCAAATAAVMTTTTGKHSRVSPTAAGCSAASPERRPTARFSTPVTSFRQRGRG